MEKKNSAIRYFLGANTARGFTSFYDEFVQPEKGDFIWYIKGGPGNGKSTFMQKIAQEAERRGETVEYAFCSGDPESLDGIYLRERHTAYVDATSPHVQEPGEPGASGRYLDLSGCLETGLSEKQEEIRRYFRLYREQYVRCYQLLSAAALAAPENTPDILQEEVHTAVRERANAFAARYLHPASGYEQRFRFFSAYTCQGLVSFWETVETMGKVCMLDNSLGLADDFLQEMRRKCIEMNIPCILCPDPLCPERLAGMLIPSCSLVLISVRKQTEFSGSVWKHFRLDSMADTSCLRTHREEIRRCAALQTGLLRQAEASLREAKRIHDALESLYRPYLVIDRLEELLAHHKTILFG